MGFPRYFLIVAYFIQWAKAQTRPSGGAGARDPAPARSRLGADISDLVAMRFRADVRALPQPRRVSMPDFDIDFCQDRASR